MVTIKSQKEIEKMREACRVTALVYEEIEKYIRPGITTMDLDHFAEKIIIKNGGIPAQKGYPSGEKGIPPFPATLCVSINDEIIHGIPSDKTIIQDGDLVSVDLVVYKNGFHGDAARTYIVGKSTPEKQRLVDITKQAFFEGISKAVKGNRVGDISNAIGEFVKKNGYKVVREFQGHGIGEEMHEDPGVPNIGRKGTGPRLQKGMALAIEPMICEGRPDVYVKDDYWTVATKDGKLTAYYENTIVIIDKEAKILTLD